MPKWNQFLSRFNLNRRQRLGRVNPEEVLYEYDVSSGDFDYTSDDCTLRYSYDRNDNKILIKPEMPYLSLLSQGGPILGLSYLWSQPFKWQYPKLSVKLVNTTDHTLLLSEAAIRVTSSKINVEPVLVIHEDDYNVGHFRIVNEGWGQVIKFKTKVSLVEPGPMGSGASAPPTCLYDLKLKAGESNNTNYLPISQEIKPGESDHFLIRVASDKSARFDLTFSFLTTGGKEIPGREVVLDLFVPRSKSDW